MNFTTNQQVVITSDRYKQYGIGMGAFGTVTYADDYSSDVRGIFTRTDGEGTQDLYVYKTDIEPADPLALGLADYKRYVARKMWDAKQEHGWCSSAEYLAGQMGMASYLPRLVTVHKGQQAVVPVFPGEQEHVAIYRARNLSDDRWVGIGETVGQTTDSAPEYASDEDEWEGETVEDFRDRLRRTAVEGAVEYGVSGVPEFLASVGIQQDVITRTRSYSVTVQVEVEVPIGDDDDGREQARAEVESAGLTVYTVYED